MSDPRLACTKRARLPAQRGGGKIVHYFQVDAVSSGTLRLTVGIDSDHHTAIAERAYCKWLIHGKPEGKDLEFWLAAERDYNECRATGRLVESVFLS